jgi:hypothetical protein
MQPAALPAEVVALARIESHFLSIARCAANQGASHEKTTCRYERELVHPDGDHPGRDSIGTDAERQRDAGDGPDGGAEDEKSLRED